MHNKINYSLNIESISKKKGLTIEKLLEISEINSSSYYKMKRNNKFTTETLEKLATTLKVKVSDLVKEPGANSKKEMLDDFERIKDKLNDFEEKHLK